MARGIKFDRPQDAWALEELRRKAKTASGPTPIECCECGGTTYPQWHEGRDTFCQNCVPESLRYAGRT